MKKIFIILFLLKSSMTFAEEMFLNKKLLCIDLLWGFEFISHNKVNVIITNINNETKVIQYYYETAFDLSYVNLYLSKKNTAKPVLSIHQDTLRVDIWTMTSGGITSRELIPTGFCKEVEIESIINYIENIKN
ncbi:MAG: hypothetical protein CFH15_01147 [Alphaproteobacteria bacterium MarineAlpha5_Bin5]|nr:MAG: hypothetical protein CFH14_01062 [Alphaproteobacteria bacterium MarineAlpha5_Bin4]PPR49540.1 MAG: hypothetical protein CFH15_01147 [Alphaproteobacteria bacterium MarineAlpha5_Bin5]|tara:strand:+ start:386 stop:784 length:399 start_codon:yes stop_codon:yes gene_type:complete